MNKGNNAEYQIKTADNGFLIQRVLEVEVDNSTDAPFKDPYERSIFVFADWAGVIAWLNGNEPNKAA
jgi:hypothetical protein